MAQTGEAGTRESILVVDDEASIRRLLVRALESDTSRRVVAVASAAEAREQLRRGSFDLVLTDIQMPGEDGLELMRWAQEHCPGPSWIVLTGYGTLDAAVQALQLGAFDFIGKPLDSLTALETSVRNATENRRLAAERDQLHEELKIRNEELKKHVERLETACRLLTEQADTIRADLRRAGMIQQALLPHEPPLLPGMTVHALYRPSENVGGDLYDVVRLDDHHVAVVIADAAGHGLAAAMLAVLFRHQLPLLDEDGTGPMAPSAALAAANRALCEGLDGGLFLSATHCLVDTRSRRVRVASAGHPPLLVRRGDGEVDALGPTGPALGLDRQAVFEEREIQLAPGDRLLLHTDGIYEDLTDDTECPAEALAERLRRVDDLGGDPLQRLFPGALPSPEGSPPEDDIILVLLAAEPGSSHLDNGTPQLLPEPAEETPKPPTLLLVGQDRGRAAVCIRGRADWSRSAAFHAHCAACIDAKRPLMVDLSRCDHLDSTFLGTIHQLAERAERADCEFRLQGATPAVEALFEELGMERVRQHMVPALLPLPTDLAPLADQEREPDADALHLLETHEVLARINRRNRREFDPLLEVLRREVARSRSAGA